MDLLCLIIHQQFFSLYIQILLLELLTLKVYISLLLIQPLCLLFDLVTQLTDLCLFLLDALELGGKVLVHLIQLVLVVQSPVVQLREEVNFVGEHVLVYRICSGVSCIACAVAFLSVVPGLFVRIFHVIS